MVTEPRTEARKIRGNFMAHDDAVTYTATVLTLGDAVTRIELPLPILFAWIVLTLVLMGQGMRLAGDRQDEREPGRILELAEGTSLDVPAGTREVLYVDTAQTRLALYQQLPERRLLRWIEDQPTAGTGAMFIPLEGLGPGDYLLGDAPESASAASQEMDRPKEERPARVRFRILPR